MKFKRLWHYGGERREDADDYVVAYVADNGATISVEYVSYCNFCTSHRYYAVNGRQFHTLTEAKKYIEK